MKPHKHAELIHAWADGAVIQRKEYGNWTDCEPKWNEYAEYRIKPEPKPDVVRYMYIDEYVDHGKVVGYRLKTNTQGGANLQLIWDGETGKLKLAEVLK